MRYFRPFGAAQGFDYLALDMIRLTGLLLKGNVSCPSREQEHEMSDPMEDVYAAAEGFATAGSSEPTVGWLEIAENVVDSIYTIVNAAHGG
jgi:hypothetical protein